MINQQSEGGLSDQVGQIATTKHGILLILAAVMPVMAIISLVPVLPLLLKEFTAVAGAQFLVPIAITIPALCVAVFSPLAGWISDRCGRKPVLLTALLIYAVIGLLPFFLTDLRHIIAARVILGVSEAAIMTVATALLGDYYEGKTRQRWVAIQMASVSISAIFLIAIGGILGEILGSRGPFLLYLLALPIALLVWLILFEPSRHTQHQPQQERRIPWANILPMLFTSLFVGVLFYTVIVKLGEILGLTSEVSPAMIGGIGAAANIGMALGAVLFRALKGASGPALVSIGFTLSAIGYGFAAWSNTLLVSSGALVIACLGFGLLLPTMLTWILKELPENVRGRGTGLWTGAFFLGQFTAPIIVAVLQNNMAGLANVLLLFAGLSCLAMLVGLVKIKNAQNLVSY